MKAGNFSDGAWDCSHTWDASNHYDAWVQLGRPTDPEAVLNVVREAWGDDGDACEAWLAANADDVTADSKGMIDPCDEYVAWRDAWQTRAMRYVRSAIPEWIAGERES